jgi:hypothetical protein
MAISFVFTTSLAKKIFLTKTLTLKIDSAASSGGQEKLKRSSYFSWPPLEAGLSISTFYFLFICAGKIFFLVYTFVMIR